jgi:eukaryotic-like serine/threonine-protein kinase
MSAIAPDSTIGNYRVESLISAGGMGEVYKAIDLKLGRPVALKILPPELSGSRERIRRFLQEARAASSLNHPNILTVYDAGEANGVHFIATELVVGSTLRDLIHKDKVPLKRVVGYLAQAADGVAKAHQAGIIHRDLKPANIMITTDGFAKVLDFGLAKLIETREDQSTFTDRTREGLILGTVAYMSPEQAQGQPVDQRSDVFAFGAILYEAGAHKQAFSGVTDPEILHRIVHEDPPPLVNVPAEFDRVVTRAMAKNPDERIQSMKDLALELRDIASTFDSLKVQTRARRRAKSAWSLAALIVVPALIAAAAGYLLHRPQPIVQPLRFAITPPEHSAFTSTSNSASALQFALSPKGNAIAFVATPAGGRPMIFVRELGSVDARPLEGTEGGYFPFWSPDGDAIGFFADGKIRRISMSGGAAVSLAVAPDPRGGSWNREGVILFSPTGDGGLLAVPASGGEPTSATSLDAAREERGQRWPAFLPDGKRFVYLSLSGDKVRRAIYAGTLGSEAEHEIVKADSNAQFVPPNELFFVRKGSLYSQRLDTNTLRPEGDPRLVQRDVGFAPSILYGSFSAASRDLIAFARWVNPNRQLTWLDRHGNELGKVFEPADWGASFLSLRGDHAILNRTEPDTGNLDLWDIELARGIGSRITSDDADENQGFYFPDGTLAFTSNRAGMFDVYLRKSADASDQRVVKAVGGVSITDVSRDGRYVAYLDRRGNLGADLWILSSDGTPRPFVQTPAYEGNGAFSPDGRWLAYMSDATGRDEVYVQPFPSGGSPFRVSVNGGAVPRWSADGRELFFVTLKSEMAVVRVKGSHAAFDCSVPTILFRIPGQVPAPPAFYPRFAVAPDGRFLMVITPTDHPTASITVAMNARN